MATSKRAPSAVLAVPKDIVSFVSVYICSSGSMHLNIVTDLCMSKRCREVSDFVMTDYRESTSLDERGHVRLRTKSTSCENPISSFVRSLVRSYIYILILVILKPQCLYITTYTTLLIISHRQCLGLPCNSILQTMHACMPCFLMNYVIQFVHCQMSTLIIPIL